MNEPAAPTRPSGLYFDLQVDRNRRRIDVYGSVDIACAPNVATAVARLQHAAAGDITIDLDRVTFIDMFGVGVLVGARTAQTTRGDRLIVTGAKPQIRRVFELGALTGLLDADATA